MKVLRTLVKFTEIETRDIIDTRNVVGIPNNYPFRDAYKVLASVIRYDYENWPSFMPVEKISIEKEKMLLKLAPKDSEGSTLEVPSESFPKVSGDSFSKEEVSNTMSPISHFHSTFNSPMTNFNDSKSQELDSKHETSDGYVDNFQHTQRSIG